MYICPKNFPDLAEHWDLEFIFRSVKPFSAKRIVTFRELKFITPADARKAEIARSHEDVLGSLGYKFLD